MELGGKFQVEPGNGGDRDEILAKHKIETFLIVPPQQVSFDKRTVVVKKRTVTTWFETWPQLRHILT